MKAAWWKDHRLSRPGALYGFCGRRVNCDLFFMSNATIAQNRQGDVWKGLVAGLVGGLVASWTMNRFQDVWMKLSANDDSASKQSSEQNKNLEADSTRN